VLFIVSNPELGITQSRAGIAGSFPALNARPGPVAFGTLAVSSRPGGRTEGW